MEFLIFNSFQAKGTSRGSKHSTTIEWTGPANPAGTDTNLIRARSDNIERSNHALS